MSVRLLLDVDGVLNAVTTSPPTDLWPIWHEGQATPDGRSFRILYAEGVAEFIRELHAADVEIVWLTTWGRWANEQISPMFGLPTFRVAGEPDYHDHGWWKLPRARELYEKDRKPFLWFDDDLAFEHEAQQWLSFLPEGHALAISPDTRAGIEPKHIEQAWDFISTHL